MINKNLIKLQIKNFKIAVIHITNISTKNMSKIIKENIQKTHNFLQYTPVIIDVSKLTYKNNWKELHQSILDSKLFVIGVCSCHDIELKKIILKSGLPIFTKHKPIQYQNNYYSIQTQNKTIQTKKTLETKLIYTPIRSGQKIYVRNRDLIIINNVSSGAEIISDGNIHIYGIMRGKILAGASGNKKCQIFCTQFFPELVSINGYYLIGDHIPTQFIGKSVRLNLENNTIIIHTL